MGLDIEYVKNMSKSSYGFIYITTNNINNMKYIGQRKFWYGWENYLGGGHWFQNALKKYGRENFSKEIIELCESENKLNEREVYWIEHYNAVKSKNFYNLMAGGNSGNKIAGYSDEEKFILYKRLGESRRGENHWNFGKKGEENHLWGRKHTEESKMKMSQSSIGKCSGKENYAARSVICITTGKIYDTISEAKKETSINNISACCRGVYCSAGKLEDGTPMKWAFYNKLC